MKRTSTATHALDEFLSVFQQELQRLLRGKGRYVGWKIDEICQEEMVLLLGQRLKIEARHNDGAHYARARAAHAAADFERRERKQCCHGVRLAVQPDGSKRAGRSSVSLDAPLGDTTRTLLDRVGATSWEDDVLDHLDAHDQLVKALLPVSADTRRIMWNAAAMGGTIAEAAQREGIRRETANRKVGAATKTIRARRDAGEL